MYTVYQGPGILPRQSRLTQPWIECLHPNARPNSTLQSTLFCMALRSLCFGFSELSRVHCNFCAQPLSATVTVNAYLCRKHRNVHFSYHAVQLGRSARTGAGCHSCQTSAHWVAVDCLLGRSTSDCAHLCRCSVFCHTCTMYVCLCSILFNHMAHFASRPGSALSSIKSRITAPRLLFTSNATSRQGNCLFEVDSQPLDGRRPTCRPSRVGLVNGKPPAPCGVHSTQYIRTTAPTACRAGKTKSRVCQSTAGHMLDMMQSGWICVSPVGRRLVRHRAPVWGFMER